MSLNNKLKALLFGACVLLSSGLMAAESQLNMRPGVTDISQRQLAMHNEVMWWMLWIGVVVFGAMFYSMWAHRKSKNPNPATFHESIKVEVIWTIIPVIILVILSYPAVKLLVDLEEHNDKATYDMSILVTGKQWFWKYKYQDGAAVGHEFQSRLTQESRDASLTGTDEQRAALGGKYLLDVDNRLVIPVNKRVQFVITSEDVIHSWWVPDFGVKKDAIPFKPNKIWAQPTQIGTYRGVCAELCGQDHGYMPIVVDVVSEADFEKWAADRLTEDARKAADKSNQPDSVYTKDELMAQGKAVYDGKCATCHGATGEGGLGKAITASPIATGDSAAHINIVVNGKSGTAMQEFGSSLSLFDLAAVVTYQRNALGNSTGDIVQPADVAEKK